MEWQVVGRRVRDRRDELGLTQEQFAAQSGVSTATIRLVETGSRDRYQRRTLRALSRALGWSADSIDRIRSGLDPVEIAAPLDQAPPDLQAEVRHLRDEIGRLRAAIELLSQGR